MGVVELLFDFVLVSIAGLFIAFSPMLIITDLLIILRSKRPVLHTLVLLVSIAMPLLLLSGLTAMVIKSETSISLKGLSGHISLPPILDILIGSLLVTYGFSRFRQTKYQPLSDNKPAKVSKAPPSKLIPLFVFGFTKSLLSLSNIVAIVFVTKLITSNKLSPLLAIIILIWTIAVGTIPFLVIIYYQKNRRRYLIRLQNRLDNLLTENLRLYLYIGLIGLGLAIGCFGVLQLFSGS